MDTLVERIDFGTGEELDSLVDWAFLAGAREGQPAPVFYHRSCGNGRAGQPSTSGEVRAG